MTYPEVRLRCNTGRPTDTRVDFYLDGDWHEIPGVTWARAISRPGDATTTIEIEITAAALHTAGYFDRQTLRMFAEILAHNGWNTTEPKR